MSKHPDILSIKLKKPANKILSMPFIPLKPLILSIVSILLILSTPSCTRKFGIQRGTGFRESTSVEIRKDTCALVRGKPFSVSLQIIGPGEWERLFAYEPFTAERKYTPRLPSAPFFHLVISNTGDQPVSIEDRSIVLVHRDTRKIPVTPKDAEKIFKSPVFSIYNFKNILTVKRLLADRNCIDEIEYDKDIIDYRLGFINPGERVLLIFSFGWIPVEFREYAIRLSLGSGESKKCIDFELNRFEYRTKGERFRKPGPRAKERLQ